MMLYLPNAVPTRDSTANPLIPSGTRAVSPMTDSRRSGIPNRTERRYPAPLKAVHDLRGDRAVGDADDSLGTRFHVGGVGQLQHIGLAERTGIPNRRVGLRRLDLID